MVYHWEGYEQLCRRLYLQEGKRIGYIMDYMKREYQFTPSKRAFHDQFRRWEFPLKQRYLHKDQPLMDRVKELWERNLGQREMLHILNREDGYNITTNELMRLRIRKRLFLKQRNQDATSSSGFENGSNREATSSMKGLSQSPPAQPVQQPSNQGAAPAPVKVSKRSQRRRKDGEPGESGSIVRFPSETPLDDARIMLNLDVTRYRDLRSQFQQICEAEGIMKKTVAGAEKWDAAKEKLIQQIPELDGPAWSTKEKFEARQLALDVICTNVTKNMRMMEAKISTAQAKNILGLNPDQYQEMRLVFYQVLGEAGFTRKSSATPQQWESLKRAWGESSVHLNPKIASMNELQERALEVLAKDISKRVRRIPFQKKPEARHQRCQAEQEQEQEQEGAEGEAGEEGEEEDNDYDNGKKEEYQVVNRSIQSQNLSPRRNPVRMTRRQQQCLDYVDLDHGREQSNFDAGSEVSHTSQMDPNPASCSMGAHVQIPVQLQTSTAMSTQCRLTRPPGAVGSSSMAAGMSLDSRMDSPLLLGPNGQGAFMGQSVVQSQFMPTARPAPAYPPVQSVTSTCAIFMRLHPTSSFMYSQNLWISTLVSDSVQELRQTAVEKFPGTVCVRIEGIVKDGKGGELPLPIELDEELTTYIAHLQGAAPTFSVQLVWKTS